MMYVNKHTQVVIQFKNVVFLFFSLAVVVEDASSSCCVTVKVFPHTTIAALKQQVRKACHLS